MKIVQILPKLDIGGVERGVLDIVKYLKGRGIQNIVISAGGRFLEELKGLGITHYKLPVHRKSPISLFLIPKLRRIFEKEKVDIIHARSRVPAWLSFFASRGGNGIFITTCHGVYKNKFFSEVMGWGKLVICPSKVAARHMRENFGVPEEKIVLIERWVDLKKFKFTPYEVRKNSSSIVSIGRISPSKGYEYLIEAFRKNVRSNPYLKLKIIGSPDKSKLEYLSHLKTLVTRFALNYNVQFVGFRDDIENVLRDARLLVAPSVIEESFGRVIVEAFACGVPVVATRVGGFSEIIEDNKDGILVESKDAQSIADGINRILTDPNLAAALTENAYRKVKMLYTIDKRLEETEALYKKALQFKRILVLKISSLGDLILSFPSLKEIREALPESKIYLLTLKKYVSLLYGCPYIDGVIPVEKNYKRFKNILRISQDLRRRSFDYIIDFQNNRASHLLSFLSFPQQSFGYSLRWGFLLGRKLKYLRYEDPLSSQERILSILGIKFKEKKLVFWERKLENKMPLPDLPLVGINVSASARWESKNWPVHHITSFIGLLNKNFPSYRVVLFGDSDAKEIGDKIEASLSPKPYNLCGKTTLGDLPELIKKTKVFISPDTATLHLARAVGVPAIALFGPTDPFRHTIEEPDLKVLYKKLFCSHCYKSSCRLKERNLCMEKISPQEVLLALKQIIG